MMDRQGVSYCMIIYGDVRGHEGAEMAQGLCTGVQGTEGIDWSSCCSRGHGMHASLEVSPCTTLQLQGTVQQGGTYAPAKASDSVASLFRLNLVR